MPEGVLLMDVSVIYPTAAAVIVVMVTLLVQTP
jgi:hypothetical protein